MTYDVFLSFRGVDTRDGFTSHLNKGLQQKMIKTFIDDDLERGGEISQGLLTAIEESKISVIVFSRNYASSKWCLNELVKIMDWKKTNKHHLLIPVFYRIKPKHVRNQTGSFRHAFAKHEENFELNTQKVETWRTALTEAANISGWDSQVTRPESRLIEEIVQDILKKLNQGWIGQVLSTTTVFGGAAKTCMEEIWAYLMDDDIQQIGVWGMGGVGKTTIMKLIQNQLLKEKKFNIVIWITVSKEMSIIELQKRIARAVKETLDEDEDVIIRAGMIYETLSRRGKYVLILDDLWDRLSLEEVGIPEPSNGSKLLVTTRSLDVCRHLDCQEVRVPTLSKQDAWGLFSEKVGKDVLNHLDLLPIVQSVAEECAGLPLAIVTIASSMKRVCSVHEWRNALDVLKRHVKSVKGMEEKIFQQLQFSYDRLQDEKVKRCFLFCALYPEDFEIKTDELINFWIAEGLVEEMDSMQTEIDTGHTILNVLKNSCLIENGFGGGAKLHDVVRDMALRITRERPRFLVKAGIRLEEIPDVRDWNEDLERVSLMRSGICQIPSQMGPKCPKLTTLFLSRCYIYSIPECFFEQMLGLKTLDLSYNRGLRRLPNSISNLKNLTALLLSKCSIDSIPECFFEKMLGLRTLDLSYNGDLERLPNSISNLKNLTALFLSNCCIKSIPDCFFEQMLGLKTLDLSYNHGLERLPNSFNLETLTTLLLGGCYGLEKVPSFSKLEALNKLDLRGTKIKHIPHGMERLVNLQYLDLSGMRITEIGDGILAKFTSLHHLDLGERLVRGEEIGALRKLEFFKAGFYDFNEWKSFVQALHASKRGLRQYNIFVGSKNYYSFALDDEHVIELNGCNIRTNDIKIFSDVEGLSFEECIIDLCEGAFLSRCNPVPLDIFSSLCRIEIIKCKNIKKLLSSNWVLHNLQNLRVLFVEGCVEMEEIIASELEEEGISSPSFKFTLPNLFRLTLRNLPELKSICGANGVIVCDSIWLIDIRNCPKLKRIPLNLPLQDDGQPSLPPSLKRILAFPEERWELVEWDHPNAKCLLEPLVCYLGPVMEKGELSWQEMIAGKETDVEAELAKGGKVS